LLLLRRATCHIEPISAHHTLCLTRDVAGYATRAGSAWRLRTNPLSANIGGVRAQAPSLRKGRGSEERWKGRRGSEGGKVARWWAGWGGYARRIQAWRPRFAPWR
jgi:hypothetical protein